MRQVRHNPTHETTHDPLPERGHEKTRLTNREADMLEKRIAHEAQMLGDPPTLKSLRAMGYTESRWLHIILNTIEAFGRILTLIVAEGIQSVASLILLVVFSLLEYWRVVHGAEALGQAPQQAMLIAFAVVVGNIVHPIFSLRDVRGQEQHEVNSPTLRGWFEAMGRRIFGRPAVRTVSWRHNPTLEISAFVLTWTTVVLAVYDLIAPLVTAIVTGATTKPNIILATELVIGLGLSFGGVFFLQATAHDIGTRIMQDQPARLTDVLAEKQREYEQKVAAIRQRVTNEYMAGKIADERRKAALSRAQEVTEEPVMRPLSTQVVPPTNGHGVRD